MSRELSDDEAFHELQQQTDDMLETLDCAQDRPLMTRIRVLVEQMRQLIAQGLSPYKRKGGDDALNPVPGKGSRTK
jgi:hypothetical protein